MKMGRGGGGRLHLCSERKRFYANNIKNIITSGLPQLCASPKHLDGIHMETTVKVSECSVWGVWVGCGCGGGWGGRGDIRAIVLRKS